MEEASRLLDRTLVRDRIAKLTSCGWVEERENLVIISEGGGESYVAQTLGVAACGRFMPVLYARLNDMFRELNVARTEDRRYEALGRFSKPCLLILDGLFTTPVENQLNAVDLFEIPGAREDRASTLVASQPGPDHWHLRINSDLCADSILNRVVERALPGHKGTKHARVHGEPEGEGGERILGLNRYPFRRGAVPTACSDHRFNPWLIPRKCCIHTLNRA